MPGLTQNSAARLALLAGIICLVLEMRTIAHSAADASAAEAQVLQYVGEWRPDSSVHQPGDEVFFQVDRHTMLHGRDPLPILIFSSFQNVDTALTYALPSVPHVVMKDGTSTITTVRQLPLEMKPGRYRLIGWAETHTEKRQTCAVFTSQIINVKLDLPEEAP